MSNHSVNHYSNGSIDVDENKKEVIEEEYIEEFINPKMVCQLQCYYSIGKTIRASQYYPWFSNLILTDYVLGLELS